MPGRGRRVFLYAPSRAHKDEEAKALGRGNIVQASASRRNVRARQVESRDRPDAWYQRHDISSVAQDAKCHAERARWRAGGSTPLARARLAHSGTRTRKHPPTTSGRRPNARKVRARGRLEGSPIGGGGSVRFTGLVTSRFWIAS